MGCGCSEKAQAAAVKAAVLPTMTFPDGTEEQFPDFASAQAAQAEKGGILRWMPPKVPTSS